MRTRGVGTIWGGALLAWAVVTLAACGSRPDDVTPRAQALFTSTRQVTSLAVETDGVLWIGTTGGVIRRAADGHCQKWDRLSGLPSQEVRSVSIQNGLVTATCPTIDAVWQGGRWQAQPLPAACEPTMPGETCRTVWQGQVVTATLDGLKFGTGTTCRDVPLPPQSPGTHISALLPHGTTLYAAMFGDGLWAWDGRAWTALRPGLPPDVREVTALAEDSKGTLWAGTRRNGVFRRVGQTWQPLALPDGPASHNAEAVTMYGGSLYVSTLEDGLAVKTPNGWRQVTAPTLSSNAPRQMVVFHGALYVRNSNGLVDRFEGTRWTQDVFPFLPRRQVSAMAADGARLYLAQWGGWSEWDGARWTHHLTLPALQGVPVTALCPVRNMLWAGTQGRGLAEIDRTTQTVRWHDERNGLPDDWVTCLAQAGGRIWAGTFVGGLAVFAGTRWTTFPELVGQNVTALEPDGAGGLTVATRDGVWQATPQGRALVPLAKRFPFLDPEAQALCAVPGGLWIGARTGLFFLPEVKV